MNLLSTSLSEIRRITKDLYSKKIENDKNKHQMELERERLEHIWNQEKNAIELEQLKQYNEKAKNDNIALLIFAPLIALLLIMFIVMSLNMHSPYKSSGNTTSHEFDLFSVITSPETQKGIQEKLEGFTESLKEFAEE